MRVVSVLPSATETVFALGHGPELVGRSAECDFPEAAARLPVVMRPRTWDADRPSREIDARVRSVRARSESLYELDIERIRDLRPDLLLTQDLCGVCSVTDAEVRKACALAGVTPEILSLSPRRLGEVWDTIERIGVALRDPAAGGTLARRLREGAQPFATSGPAPRVAVVEWLDPPILAGLWVPEIVRAAGGEPVGPAPGEAGERTSWSALERREVDLVILSPCSFSAARTLGELKDPRLRAGVERLAPRLGIFVADEAYFSRPGPRLADGVTLVRELLRGVRLTAPMPVQNWTAAATRVAT
jgi:iron complex transport system substrate-binding protein